MPTATKTGKRAHARRERRRAPGHNGRESGTPPRANGRQKAPTPKINKDWQKLLRPLTDTERELLRESIKAHGVMVPILLDERGYIIDGMHRWQIAQELGEHCPRRMVEGLSEAQKLEQVLLLNAARRQMAGSEITAAARKLRREGFSTRKIGELLGVSKDTAHRATKGTEPKGGNVTDTRGRKQPARKARPKAGKNGSEPENVNVYAVIMDGLGLCLQATTLANPRKLRLTKEERKALLDRIKKCIDRLQKTFAAWA